MDNYKERLIPENDLQELWELNGRKYAVMEYIKNEKYPDTKIIYIMLGGDKADLAWKENDK